MSIRDRWRMLSILLVIGGTCTHRVVGQEADQVTEQAKAFWAGKVVWLSDDVLSRSREDGHKYPPVPFRDPEISQQLQAASSHAAGEQVSAATVERAAFWSKVSAL